MVIGIIALKMKFSFKDIFSKCEQIRRKLQIWSHLLNKYLMENFIFCIVWNVSSLHENDLSVVICHSLFP